MKFSAVSAILFAAGAQACALYSACICTNANGTPDNHATQLACHAQNEPHKELIGTGGLVECHFTGDANTGFLGLEENGLDNCNFREACAAAGATGDDSSCTAKL